MAIRAAISSIFAGTLLLASHVPAWGQDGIETPAPESFKDCEDCPEMIVIPAGSVVIGSHEHEAYRRGTDRPKQTAVIAQPFALAKNEVTLAEFRVFMAETDYQQPAASFRGETLVGCNYFDGVSYGYVAAHNWENPGFPQREDEPVVCVSWSDATAFAEWMSEKTGRTYRIPSSVEFEYAMRGGSEAPWPWGNDPTKACAFGNVGDRAFGRQYPAREIFSCDDGYIFPTGVGSYKPNAFGLYDIFGNAWEWTDDCWHTDLTEAPLDGSAWGEEDGGQCDLRTPKGGGWTSAPSWARSASRSADGAHYRSFMLGFRLAADVE